jgi:O-antigen/teichoic acid export membrane protein
LTQPPADNKRMGARALRSIFWVYFSYVGGRVLGLVAFAALARLLVPEELGIVGFALVFMAVLDTIKDLGFADALVASRPEQVYKRANTVFVAGLGIGILLSLITAGASPFVADFFNESQLKTLLPVLGLNFAIRGLGSTHYALLQKEMQFQRRTMADFAEVLVRGLVSVGLAFAGAGVWSLVFGYLAGTAALVIAVWLLISWRPKLRVDRDEVKPMLRFGGALTGVDITAAIVANVDYLFVGKVLGPAALGVYTLAFRLPELAIVNVASVTGQVLFPAFANIDRGALSHAYTVALRYMLMLCLPLAVGMALLSEPLVHAVFGGKWDGAVGPMQLLTLYGFAVTVGIPAGTAYKAVGRADVLLKLAIPRTILLVGAIAIFVSEGTTAVAGCQAAVAGLFSVIGILLASRLLSVPLRRLLRLSVTPVVASAAMAAVILGIDFVIDGALLTLVLAGLAGGAVYLALLAVLAPDAVRDIRSKLRRTPAVETPDMTTVRETDVVA